MMDGYKLENVIQEYPWGSVNLMPRLFGHKNKKNKPFAEMWMGVHPRGPSRLKAGEKELDLSEFIRSAPREVMGASAKERFGDSLPFLFKVLAAGQPLSIQAHPNKAQAEEGFAREETEGIPVDAFHRNYRDDNHKPEVLCALTTFTAMCGFRRVDDIRSRFARIDSSVVRAGILPALDAEGEEDRRLKNFFYALMSLEDEEMEELARALTEWAENEDSEEARLVRMFYSLHGVDRGLASPLYLNVVNLRPGEALFQPAGVLHAYVGGMGVELMANSDNVLRGGMTKKHVDVRELLSILDFHPRRPDIITPESDGDLETYDVPIDEFRLERLRLGEDAPIKRVGSRTSVDIGICVEGDCRLRASDGGSFSPFYLSQGESYVLPYEAGAYEVELQRSGGTEDFGVENEEENGRNEAERASDGEEAILYIATISQ